MLNVGIAIIPYKKNYSYCARFIHLYYLILKG